MHFQALAVEWIHGMIIQCVLNDPTTVLRAHFTLNSTIYLLLLFKRPKKRLTQFIYLFNFIAFQKVGSRIFTFNSSVRFFSSGFMVASYSKMPFASSNKIDCSLYFSWNTKWLCVWIEFNVFPIFPYIYYWVCLLMQAKWIQTSATSFDISQFLTRRSVSANSASCKSTSNFPRKMLLPGSSTLTTCISSLQRLIFRFISVSQISANEWITNRIQLTSNSAFIAKFSECKNIPCHRKPLTFPYNCVNAYLTCSTNVFRSCSKMFESMISLPFAVCVWW